MGIVKLFSKHREKNTRTVSLKYDQRRHSSTSYFTASPSIYSIPVDTKMNNRPIDSPNGLVLNRDSALMLNTSGIFPKGTSILSTTGTDIQHTSKPRRKSESKQSNQRSSQYSKRRSTSKVLSMYDLKCTCETPSTSRERNNRASVPILDTAISNKYEFDSKEKSLKDPKNDSQLENGSGAGATDNTLYSELLSTQLSLKSIMIKDPPEVHKTVGLAIIRIGGALEMASSLESRLKTVIEVSKKTILDKAQKIKDLEYQLQDGKPSLDAALQDNKLLKIKLKEVEDTIRHVECLLLESQIEPTKEEGGTLLQRIESLLAISTASSLLNDKLRSELETSDTMVEELFDETSKLLKLVESDDQKLKQEKELCRLQTKVYDLEKNINYLNHQLESNQDTIRQLKDENQQKSKQLSDSYIAFRKKEDIEFCNNIIRPETIQHENRHFSELPDEDSLTAWQEIAQNRSQLGGFNYKSNKSSLIDFDQSDTEQQTSQFPYTDMKQSFSGFLELPEELDRKHPQVNSHQPVTKGNMLDKTNEFFHHGGLVDQSNDTNQYNLESKSQPLNRSISIDQYTSMNSKVTSYNTHLLKAFYSIQDMESLTHSGVYHEGIKSENDLSLHIHKNTDFRYAGSTHDGTQISGTMYSKKDLNHQHSGSDMLGNRIFKGDIQSTGLENVTLYPGRKTKKQEELIRIHTRAQLGLIEYLEGENNVTLALSRFRKQLENEMDELEYLN